MKKGTDSSEKVTRPASILAVDDNPGFLQLTAHVLKEEGYKVFQARTGAQALQVVSQQIPDLVLLDVGLPVFDGFQVCRMLKKDPEFRYVPVVMLTAQKSPETHLQSFECGANDFLFKPVNLGVLLAHVRGLLQFRFTLAALEESREGLREQLQEKTAELAQLRSDLEREATEHQETAKELRKTHSRLRNLATPFPRIPFFGKSGAG